jgi:DNA-binding NtrC family response regulator
VTYDAPTLNPDAVRERRVLVVIGGGTVVERELPPPNGKARLVIGRALECDVRIDDPTISRTHLVLVVDRRISLTVESRGGKTRVDGREVATGTTVVLEPGQLVELGASRLVVRRDRELASSAGTRGGGGRPMDATRHAIDVAAKSDLAVLLLGETGAGKEVAMEQIVAQSRRKNGPLVRIDCAALPANRLERELLGHEKSAGLFESANGGTVFLDEIANVPVEVQAKLLGVIEARAVTRLGTTSPRAVDVRVIAATNADIRARVAEGKFREDLYFRLAGIVISVPPLRERADEIADLAKRLVVAEAARTKSKPPELSDAALALLVAYRWPGNVRELRNVVVRAMHVADPITADSLALGTTQAPSARDLEPSGTPQVPPKASDRDHAEIEDERSQEAPGTPGYERARIVAAMDRAKGNQKEAARMLGMTRRMLMYRLDTYGLPRPRKR